VRANWDCLYSSRHLAIDVTELVAVTPPTTNYQQPTTPEGFIGEGQNETWIAAALANDYDTITNKGYSTWLDEDYVGYNEQNGHFRADITVEDAVNFIVENTKGAVEGTVEIYDSHDHHACCDDCCGDDCYCDGTCCDCCCECFWW